MAFGAVPLLFCGRKEDIISTKYASSSFYGFSLPFWDIINKYDEEAIRNEKPSARRLFAQKGKRKMSFLGSMELDPEYMALYAAAAVLSTIGLFIMFRESRARKKALEEEKAAFEAEREKEKQEQEKRQKRAAKRKRH